MNREEIEKMFDEKFIEDFGWWKCVSPIATIREIKSFFFDTILLEVLVNIFPWNWDKQWDEYDSNTITEEIKKIAKTQYNITL